MHVYYIFHYQRLTFSQPHSLTVLPYKADPPPPTVRPTLKLQNLFLSAFTRSTLVGQHRIIYQAGLDMNYYVLHILLFNWSITRHLLDKIDYINALRGFCFSAYEFVCGKTFTRKFLQFGMINLIYSWCTLDLLLPSCRPLIFSENRIGQIENQFLKS